jgi:hypothetical protein
LTLPLPEARTKAGVAECIFPLLYYIYIFLDVVAVRIDVVVSLLASKLFFSQLATPPMLINASAPAIEFEG